VGGGRPPGPPIAGSATGSDPLTVRPNCEPTIELSKYGTPTVALYNHCYTLYSLVTARSVICIGQSIENDRNSVTELSSLVAVLWLSQSE